MVQLIPSFFNLPESTARVNTASQPFWQSEQAHRYTTTARGCCLTSSLMVNKWDYESISRSAVITELFLGAGANPAILETVGSPLEVTVAAWRKVSRTKHGDEERLIG